MINRKEVSQLLSACENIKTTPCSQPLPAEAELQPWPTAYCLRSQSMLQSALEADVFRSVCCVNRWQYDQHGGSPLDSSDATVAYPAA